MAGWSFEVSQVLRSNVKLIKGLGIGVCALGVWLATPALAAEEFTYNPLAYLQTQANDNISEDAARDFNRGWVLALSNFRSRQGEALMLLDRADRQGHPYAKIALLYLQSKIADHTFSYVEHQFTLVPVLVGDDPVGVTLAARAIVSATDFLSKTPQGIERLLTALDRAIAKEFVPAYYVKGRILLMIDQEEEGYKLISQGAEQGNALSRHYLAHAGIQKQYDIMPDRIFQLLNEAVSDGDLGSIQDLAYCYEKGIGVAQDKLKAISLYRESMRAGDAGSAMAFAKMQLALDSPNYVETFKALHFAYNNKKLEAANALGYLYMEGLGVRPNKRKGIQLFEEAAERGDIAAIENLIYCYRDGNGVKADFKRVRQYQEQLKSLQSTYGLKVEEALSF